MFNKTVLVVERDPIEAKKILDFFKQNNFRNKIEVVHNKTEALDYIFATGPHKDRPDHEVPGLILLDLLTNMTKELKILKPLQWYLRTQTVPFIILTSSEEQEKEVIKFGFGAVGYIRKPLDFTHFIEVIQGLSIK
ncbi:MAG: two-component system response regulator [Candidatus Omnitrophica bacterium CG11_big_fil_rev_8_21_14_0_20_45_26]|uniref:Two-component system response regulator n=1 Tax=Candidatus Abzuiibacterium crystallinum TaxID=1974748 RepID=A0A2H0LNI3_9BACT|nr:MAG: two-component system response regulator [Candidatus Omnitrophica bacterium CG11_big_fil_rev_8_21_14_0_20_45_26]